MPGIRHFLPESIEKIKRFEIRNSSKNGNMQTWQAFLKNKIDFIKKKEDVFKAGEKISKLFQ